MPDSPISFKGLKFSLIPQQKQALKRAFRGVEESYELNSDNDRNKKGPLLQAARS